jgi:hypothetical protein
VRKTLRFIDSSFGAPSMHTYTGVCYTMKCEHSLFDTQSSRNNQLSNVPTKLNPILDTNNSPNYTHTHTPLGIDLGVLHSISPYFCIVLSALHTHVYSKLSKVFKEMHIRFLHRIIMFPGCILRNLTGPLKCY